MNCSRNNRYPYIFGIDDESSIVIQMGLPPFFSQRMS
jgi:hypothetical protein